jgi:tripartite-type tricarboxylate transporter receptor subunit TctC
MHAVMKFVAAAAVGFVATAAHAEYPDRPIAVINPNSAGGSTDVGIRTWQPYVEKCLGEGAVLVPSAHPGAASAVGNALLAQSPPDGYTVGAAPLPNLISNRLAKPDLPALDDFVFLGNFVGVRSTLNVLNESQFQTLQDALDYMKASETPVNVAIGGIGADDHLVGLQLQQLVGVELNFIPFGADADSRNALLGKQVDFAFMSNVQAANFSDSIRPLAIAADVRSDLFPDTPTFKETGLELVGGGTHIMIAPKGMPEEAVKKWADCIQTAAHDPLFLEDAKKRNLSLLILTAEETEAFAREQLEILTELWNADPWIE